MDADGTLQGRVFLTLKARASEFGGDGRRMARFAARGHWCMYDGTLRDEREDPADPDILPIFGASVRSGKKRFNEWGKGASAMRRSRADAMRIASGDHDAIKGLFLELGMRDHGDVFEDGTVLALSKRFWILEMQIRD